MNAVETRELTPPDYNPKERSCLKCGNMETCLIFRFVGRFVEEEFVQRKVKAPFPAESIAKQCLYYNPLRRLPE